ncbi:MAG: ATP-dependent Clp protease ATP-binding subunit ClpA [Desulfovibrio sp.]|jgi:ATP-dependent Clp protease ATP-binding subunit ClpA|nr:ATP-dependent Clp protease ATP-binding subunit ClpA [Desulfovibrio sp.]
MLSNNVQNILHAALMEVHKRRHDLLTVEHLLYALTNNVKGRIILEGSGVSVAVLREQLEGFFREEMIPVENAEVEITQTLGVQRVLGRAFNHIRSVGRKAVEIGDLLVSIIDEEESYATFYLRKQGVERPDVLTFISHGLERSEDLRGVNTEKEETKNTDAPLEKFTVDLTAQAREGKIDPLIGRRNELQRAIEVLCRRRKNNPLFVGDPGVGKTALAEGLALWIAEGLVPQIFAEARIFALDMGLVLAGTRYRGDFENRIKAVIQALKNIPNAILFVDEIHTLVGAGGTSSGSMDASNLLKPALANGEIRCVGSTTHEEYRNHLEKDRAFARRFQRIDLREPNTADCLAILQGLADRYAIHHRVRYTHSVLKAIVDLSSRHIRDRLLPDKSIDVMDEVGAAVYLRQMEKFPQSRTDGNTPIPTVSMADIERVVARMAGIPQRSVSGKERKRLATLERDLKKFIFGQDHAIELTVRAILRSRAGLGEVRRPAGAFLFYGPTGVGKTEMARCLARLLDIEFLRYDMSEYMEKHSVAKLIGAPPGYVGFGEGGILTETVRRAPYSVILLDELEKAHPDIFNVLLQVMDYATLTDSTGRKTNFSNVIVIMTSNAGAFEMSKTSIGFGKASPHDAAYKALNAVENIFSPEFRNRLDALVPFKSLTPEMMLRIVEKFLAELRERLAERNVRLYVSARAKEELAFRGFDSIMGARPLHRLMRNELEDRLVNELLFGELKKGGKVLVTWKDESFALTVASG